MKMYLELSHTEVQEQIPYAVICECRESARWNTGRRKRMWKEMFSEAEREAASRLFRQAHLWYLIKGVPESVKMTVNTLHLWNKLGCFCASV